MTELQHTLFSQEIDLIQARHFSFFPDEQKDLICVTHDNSGFQLSFLEGYNLSSAITLEIQLAFKLVMSLELTQ